MIFSYEDVKSLTQAGAFEPFWQTVHLFSINFKIYLFSWSIFEAIARFKRFESSF